MAKPLQSVKKPVQEELQRFEQTFKSSMKSRVPLLDKITYYLVQRKGKQVRPIFVFLSAKLCGAINESTYHSAALVELLHTATLVHDDVVDDSYERRGFFSINALWKNKVAVLVGDFLLSKGLLLALENEEYELLQIISKAVKDMSEGELLQLEKARKLDIREEIYYDIIRQKTASLIAAACSAGASTTGSKEDVAKMFEFGEKIGIAFQIKDDLFDYGTSDVGKPLGIDIKEKKMTLPLIYALQQTDAKQRKYIIKTIRKHSENKQKVAEVIEFVRKSGGLKYAEDAMYQYRKEAFEILDTMPDNDARSALRELVVYVTERKK